MTKFSLKLAFLTITGSFGALLMGWLVVVARGHLFTLCLLIHSALINFTLFTFAKILASSEEFLYKTQGIG